MKGFAFFKSVMIQLDFAFPNFSPFLSKDIVVLLCFQPIKHKGSLISPQFYRFIWIGGNHSLSAYLPLLSNIFYST